MVRSIAPWQQPMWQRFQSLITTDRMPHAALLYGPSGTGKLAFARSTAKRLVCESPAAEGACGECRGCHLVTAGSHPDAQEIMPLEGKSEIAVEQIRQMIERTTLTRQYGNHRCLIVAPAERMSIAAANTLLKTLEEPPLGTILVLVTDRPNALLSTIRSRCQQFRFPIPAMHMTTVWLAQQCDVDETQATQLLEAALGAPLRALELHSSERLVQREEVDATLRLLLGRRPDPLAIAQKWSKIPLDELLYWMNLRVTDLIKRVSTEQLKLDLKHLYCILDAVTTATRWHVGRANPNAQLMLEILALTWAGQYAVAAN